MRASYQSRDHTDVAFQCGLDFETDQIIWILEPDAPLIVCCRQPLPTDDGDQHLARTDDLLNLLDNGVAGTKGLKVSEYLMFGAEVGMQTVIQTASVLSAVLAPVADEYAAHGSLSGLPARYWR